MKLSYINKINFKKLRTYKGKSMFLIIPITFLMTIGIVVSSQAQNILDASEQTIFGTAAESGRLIELSSQQVTGGVTNTGGEQGLRMMFGGDTNYTDSDLDKVSAITNVEAAALTVSVPISQVVVQDLFPGKEFSLNNLRMLDEDLSAQYTDKDFTYQAGQPIPIILNARSFNYSYEDWGGQDEVAVDIGGMRRGGPDASPQGDIEELANQTPFKFEAIPYSKDELIGKEITINFGGLDPLQTYEQEFTGSGVLFRKLIDELIQTNEDQRQSDISTYWNYDSLKQPLTYTFKVVGVLESESSFASYMPTFFANTLMEQYIQHQLDARTDTEIPTDLLNSTFYGMTYDGLELQSSGIGGVGGFRIGPGAMGFATNGEQSEASTSYTIPGLVIKTEREEGDTDAFQRRIFGSAATAEGIFTDPTVFEQAVQSSDTIVIKINNIDNRSQVVGDLNEAGYAYQDLNDQEVFSELQNTMNKATTIVTISFVVLSAIIIILTMGKFVSESTKEIGVFRAIGAKKKDIKQLFMSQALLYTLIGYLIGGLLGFGLVLALAKPVQLWFDGFIENTVEETFTVVQSTSAGVFTHIDWTMFGVYSLLLLVIALVVSIVPATRASRVSPVEAIRSE